MMDVSTKPQYQQLPTSCVQCCSALADDRPLSAACWYSGLQFLSPLCSNPSTARCPSCTSQGCHQLFVMPGRNLSHSRRMTAGFLCFAPHPGAGCRQMLHQTCPHLLPTRAVSGDGAEAMQVSEHPGNDSNRRQSTKTSV